MAFFWFGRREREEAEAAAVPLFTIHDHPPPPSAIAQRSEGVNVLQAHYTKQLEDYHTARRRSAPLQLANGAHAAMQPKKNKAVKR